MLVVFLTKVVYIVDFSLQQYQARVLEKIEHFTITVTQIYLGSK